MILEVEDLYFSYRDNPVLKGINFAIRDHEVVAICGPNGAGKTTLLRCINSILTPDSGKISIEENDLSTLNRNQIARKFGYVAQQSQIARTTVFDSILLGRHPYISFKPTEKDLRVVNATIEKLHLQPLSLRYLDQLSGGELQKVSIARAIVQEPRVMLLDEPTSSLDLKNQVEILNLIKNIIRGHEMAALMTMHDLNRALQYADQLLFLKEGKIFASCSPDQVSEKLIEKVYDVKVLVEQTEEYPVIIPIKR
ncbi:MAG: ABC transporter ATP-binding protein [bacterium]